MKRLIIFVSMLGLLVLLTPAAELRCTAQVTDTQLTLVATYVDVFPPPGFDAWHVTIGRMVEGGTIDTIIDQDVINPEKTIVFPLDISLEGGNYVGLLEMYTDQGRAADCFFNFTVEGPQPPVVNYIGHIPWAANAGGWETSIVLTNFSDEMAYAGFWIYDEDGMLVDAPDPVSIPPHGSTSFYFQQEFRGNIIIRSQQHLSFEALSRATDGSAFIPYVGQLVVEE